MNPLHVIGAILNDIYNFFRRKKIAGIALIASALVLLFANSLILKAIAGSIIALMSFMYVGHFLNTIIEPPLHKKEELDYFKISLAHPRLLSKRFTSSFIVQIYLPEARGSVTKKLRNEFDKEKPLEHTYDSELIKGNVVIVKLYSPEIEFSAAVIKKMSNRVNVISFVGKPKDNCHPGLHWATLSISDEKTNHEYQSVNFPVKIIDFAFDHVSRPFLSNIATVLLGIGSLSMFILTSLGQIDTVFGLASGTTAGALATVVYMRFISLYQRPNLSNHP